MSFEDDQQFLNAASRASQQSRRKAEEAFRLLTEQESDPVKQAKLQEFLPLVAQAKDAHGVEWFQKKAIATAAATRKLYDQAEAKETARLKRQNEVKTVWIVCVIISILILATGFSKVYYAKLPDGQNYEISSLKGEDVQIGRRQVHLAYDHTGYLFRKHAVVRLVTLGALLVCAYFFALSKDY